MKISRPTQQPGSDFSGIQSRNAAALPFFLLLAAALSVFLFLCCRAADEAQVRGYYAQNADQVHSLPAMQAGEGGAAQSAIRANSADSVQNSVRSERTPRLTASQRILTSAAALLLISAALALLFRDSRKSKNETQTFLFQLFPRASLPARAGPFFA